MYFWDSGHFPTGLYVFLRFWPFSNLIQYITEILDIFPQDSMYFRDFGHFTTWFYVYHEGKCPESQKYIESCEKMLKISEIHRIFGKCPESQ
jgi:hypothetical protein